MQCSQKLSQQEIKQWQMENQFLSAPSDVKTVARGLCGLQAQFLGNALHGLYIRTGKVVDPEEENLVKNWTIRGTVHVFPAEDLPLYLHKGRGHSLRPMDTQESDAHSTAERKAFFAKRILVLVQNGTTERKALKDACFAAGMTQRESQSVFHAWGGTLRFLCESGRLCHGVREKKAFMPCPAFIPMEQEEAEREMARRYFTNYGPATVRDAAYFFGIPQARVKKWMKNLPLSSVFCGEKQYFYIENGAAGKPVPPCVFLAGFDPLLLGYKKTESLYLPPEHLRGIFNLAGIVMPAILLDGIVVGRWKQKEGKLDLTLFAALPQENRRAIEEEAGRLWPALKKILWL